jgi:cytochrome c
VSRLGTVVICGAITLVASLALTRVHPFGDAGLYEAKAAEKPIMERSPVPPEVRAILVPKCADCHSTQTRAPFYGHFAPVSWLMERDIVEARKSMNLSQWEAYSPDQQQTFAAKIVHEAKAHEMPPVQYRLIHWNARVEDAEIRALANWAHVSPSESDQQTGMAIRSGARDSLRNAALDAIRWRKTTRAQDCRGSTGAYPARSRTTPTPRR